MEESETEEPRRFTADEFLLGLMKVAIRTDEDSNRLFDVSHQLDMDEQLTLFTSLSLPPVGTDQYERIVEHLLDQIDPGQLASNVEDELKGCRRADWYLDGELDNYKSLHEYLMRAVDRVRTILRHLSSKQRELGFTQEGTTTWDRVREATGVVQGKPADALKDNE